MSLRGQDARITAGPSSGTGALDARAIRINDVMMIAAAREIAAQASDDGLTPSILDRELHRAVAAAVKEAAFKAGDIISSRSLEL